MKPVTQPLSNLTPKDAVATAGLKAKDEDEKIQAKSYSLPKKHIRMIRNHATALQQKQDETVSESAALRDILDRAQL